MHQNALFHTKYLNNFLGKGPTSQSLPPRRLRRLDSAPSARPWRLRRWSLSDFGASSLTLVPDWETPNVATLEMVNEDDYNFVVEVSSSKWFRITTKSGASAVTYSMRHFHLLSHMTVHHLHKLHCHLLSLVQSFFLTLRLNWLFKILSTVDRFLAYRIDSTDSQTI